MVAGTGCCSRARGRGPGVRSSVWRLGYYAALRRSFQPVNFTANLNALTESEIEVVETFLRRRWDLADGPRQWMAWRVAIPIMFKIRPDYEFGELYL